MKANELMIGDWVFCEGQPTPSNVRIKNIADDGVWFEGGKYEGAAFYDRIFPIPITPEILEKNGFHYTNQHTLKTSETYVLRLEQRGFDFIITIKLNDWFALDSYDDRVYRLAEISTGRWCVHDLQHALRLCGIEKEIEL